MKLLRIEVENLNSLYGKHVVALEEQFGGEPLFLITGPTGAGKSTLMDAVSLALFGRTPRLAQGRGKDDEDPRLILSRGTGRGGALVEFSRWEDGGVTRYRATWVVRRARDRADGALQAAERMLEKQDANGQWQTLVCSMQVAQLRPHFDRVLSGMTVDDFQRAVLLAQGQFAAFLQATEDDRAVILERLTGTGRFLTIGQRASVKRREHEDAVRQAQAQLDAVQSLSAEEEQHLTAERERLQLAVQQGDEDLQRERDALTWLQQADTLAVQLGEAERGLAAAEQAHADAGPQLAQLTEHERCAVAAETLRKADELLEQQNDLRQQAADQAAKVETQTANVAAAEPEAQAAQTALALQRADADRLQPEIGAAGQLYAQLRAEQGKAIDADTASQQAATQAAQAARALSDRREQQRQLAEKLQQAQDRLQQLHDAAPLVTAAAGLHQQHTQVREQHNALATRRQQVAARQDQLAAGRAEHAAKAAERQALADQLAAKQLAEQESAGALAAALAGALDPASRRAALRAQRDAAQAQQQAATQVLEHLHRRDALAGQQATAAEELQRLQGFQTSIAAEHNDAAAQLSALAATRDDAQKERDALQLLRDLVQERAQLQAEQPCPLCGSLEHPYVERGRLADAEAHAVARCAELGTQLAELEQQAQTLQAKINGLELELARQDQKALAQTAELARLRDEHTGTVTQLQAVLQQLGLPADCDAATVREALDEAIAAQLANSRAEQALESAEASLRETTAALQNARQAIAALDVELAGREAGLAQQQRDLAQRQADADGAAADLQTRLQTLVGQLASFGIAGPVQLQTPADLDALAAALQTVSERAAAYTSAHEKAQQANLEAAAAVAAAEQAAVLAKASADAAATAAKAAAVQHAAVRELQTKCQQVLQGRDPDVVQAELAKAVQAAEQRANGAEEVLQTAGSALVQAQAQHDETAKRLVQASDQLQTAQAELQTALQALGLADAAALRARLLPALELAELQRLRNALEQATARAQGKHEVSQQALANHALQRPNQLELDATAADQAQRVQTLQDAQSQQREQLATVRGRLEQNNANHAERDRLRQLVADKRQTYAVWQRLHELIGVGDGKAFQKFAQILNLEELAGKANHHLQRLAPRYRLVVARNARQEPLLDFAVEDEYQAEERRPLTTLSGGETFLVSLSLALALADYRAVQMPIETLLLDEGFGTLDPQTLASAMAALKALSQTSGVQVGLISHVESLKQEIPARVVVEQQGNGRSVVRMEVGL